MSAFTQINLSKLPPAIVIQDVSFDAVLADLKADYLDRYPDAAAFIELESSPIVKLLEAAAYRETVLLNRINQAAKSVMLATAVGPDLDNLAAIVPVQRLPDETDAAFRARVKLAPEAFSTAGPRGGYEFHAKSVHVDITDIYIGEPSPGVVDVYILTVDAAVPQSILDAIATRLRDDEVRPLNDNVIIKPFAPVPVTIEATLAIAHGPDSTTVLSAARSALDAHLQAHRRFGQNLNRAGLISALFVEGVENVTLSSPAADIDVDANAVAIPTNVSVTEANDV